MSMGGARRGVGSKDSERLEKEAGEMASKLDALRVQMSREKEKREAKPRGNWQSARSERGSVRAYGKEIREREKGAGVIRRSLSGGGARTADQLYSKTAPLPGRRGEVCVATWTVGQVANWLEGIGLPQYREAFESNEITGPVLLDLGLDDLDYLQVKVLAHRKKVLTSIADLASQQGAGHVEARRPPKDDDAREDTWEALPEQSSRVGTQQAAAKEKAHWSALKPLAEKTGGGPVDVNSADAAPQPLAAGGNSAAWDPLAAVADEEESSLLLGDVDEAAEQRAFQRAVQEWRNGPSKAEDKAEAKQVIKLPAEETLLRGDPLDEAEEQRAFQRAVAEWRGVKEEQAVTAASNASVTAASNASGDTPRLRTAAQVAESLAIKLDQAHCAEADTLAQKKEAAESMLKAAIETAAQAKDGAPSSSSPPRSDDDDDDFKSSSSVVSESKGYADDSDSDSDSFSEDGELRMMMMIKSASTARVALVDSKIGCHSNTAADDKPEYTVDEQ